MSQLLDEHYLTWLYGQVANVRARKPSKTYWNLFKQLYTTEFIWFVPNDDNRVEDGRDLRYEFFDIYDIDDEDEWLGLGCSFLELLFGLARRLTFEAEHDVNYWFWVLLNNLDLSQYNDETYSEKSAEGKIGNVVDDVIWRTYSPDGSGGLFPLKNADQDQRDVELWYQLSAYVIELY